MILFHINLSKKDLSNYLYELTDAYTHYGFGNYRGKLTSASEAMEAETMDVLIEYKAPELYFFTTLINGDITVQNDISLSAVYMLLTYMFGADALRSRITPINKQDLIQSIHGQTILHLSLRMQTTYWVLQGELKEKQNT